MTKIKLLRPAVLALTGIIMSAGLSGCDNQKQPSAPAADQTALPLATGPATPIAPAPAASALPSAPPVKTAPIRQADDYAYVDRAYAMSNAIGDAPPDYGFDYQGVHPWVWRSSSNDIRLTVPVQGGYRYYYYQPGQTEPYLVRDPQYSYAYSGGALVAIYSNDGRLLPRQDFDRRADDASRYLARGRALHKASLESQRRKVNAANWARQRDDLNAARARWQDDQNSQGAWHAYHTQHESEERAYWQGERDQREQSARSFDDWRSRDYAGSPPPPVHHGARDNNNGNNQDTRGRRNDRAGMDQNGNPPDAHPRDSSDTHSQNSSDAHSRNSSDAHSHDGSDRGHHGPARYNGPDSHSTATDRAQMQHSRGTAAAQRKAHDNAIAQTQAKVAQKAQDKAAKKAANEATAAQKAQDKADAKAAAAAEKQKRHDNAIAQAQANAAQKAQDKAARKAANEAAAAQKAQAKVEAKAAAASEKQKAHDSAMEQAQAKAAQKAQDKAARKAKAKAGASDRQPPPQ